MQFVGTYEFAVQTLSLSLCTY